MAKNAGKSVRLTVTLTVVVVAGLCMAFIVRNYFRNPWTRDGQVRAQIIQIAPNVSGDIVELSIKDNQLVSKGDLLFKIDPRTFKASVAQAKASVDQAKAAAADAKDQRDRAHQMFEMDKGSISKLTVVAKDNALLQATAVVQAAEASLHSAELNLQFTDVYAPTEGYITNLKLRPGSHVVGNQPVLALIDSNSFWVHGFFKETQINNIHAGDKAIITLMSHPDRPLEGVVDSIGGGIAQQDGSPGVDMLPNINPSFDWIRLAQRIPVRIHLTEIPKDIVLRVGTTASVVVHH